MQRSKFDLESQTKQELNIPALKHIKFYINFLEIVPFYKYKNMGLKNIETEPHGQK
jgi:hypothetical protein